MSFHLLQRFAKHVFRVYDWLHRKKVSQFFNGNPQGSSITSLHFINEEVGGIILTGAGTFIVGTYVIGIVTNSYPNY